MKSAIIALLSGLAIPLIAQSVPPYPLAGVPIASRTTTIAMLETSVMPPLESGNLPDDALSALYTSTPDASSEDQVSLPVRTVAGHFDTVVLPGQRAVDLHGTDYFVYSLHDSFNTTALAGIVVSGSYSQLIDSSPHYGRDADAYGKRVGVAALRNTIQTMTTDAIFTPMFHDDPRYYAMGNEHNFVNRVFYAASRVVVTRSSRGPQHRLNAPLLLGYGVAAGANNAYYPDGDRGAKNTAENWAASLGGAALGFEVSEFLDDALRALHLRKN